MIEVCILASGFSRRMGSEKLLADLDGVPLIRWALNAALASGIGPVHLICRSEAVASQGQIAGVTVLDNPDAETGQSAGVRLAVTRFPDAEGWLFVPGDQPLVRPETLRRMADSFRQKPLNVVSLCYGADRGSPTLFPGCCRDALLTLSGDQGGRTLLRNGAVAISGVCASDPSELWDVDTEQDLQRIRLWVAQRKKR